MTEFGKLGSAGDAAAFTCARCEAAISDALDNMMDNGDRLATPENLAAILPAAIRQPMAEHLAACPACSRLYSDAWRGQVWLDLLKAERPEPPAALAQRIFSQTSGMQTSGIMTPAVAGAGNIVPMRPGFAGLRNAFGQPRLAMTAAMAFFSLTLTLNLTGVKLSELRLDGIKPGNLREQFYQADAQAIRYYDNLPVVYELESSVDQMRRLQESETNQAQPSASPDPDTQQKQPDPNGSSMRDIPTPNHNALAAPQTPQTPQSGPFAASPQLVAYAATTPHLPYLHLRDLPVRERTAA